MAEDKKVGPVTTTEDLGKKLFDPFVDALVDTVKNGEEIASVDKQTGEIRTKRVKPTPAYLSMVRQFLRDQNINASAAHHKGLKELSTALPFDPDEDEGNVVPFNQKKTG